VDGASEGGGRDESLEDVPVARVNLVPVELDVELAPFTCDVLLELCRSLPRTRAGLATSAFVRAGRRATGQQHAEQTVAARDERDRPDRGVDRDRCRLAAHPVGRYAVVRSDPTSSVTGITRW
jgi:hypothetical protein